MNNAGNSRHFDALLCCIVIVQNFEGLTTAASVSKFTHLQQLVLVVVLAWLGVTTITHLLQTTLAAVVFKTLCCNHYFDFILLLHSPRTLSLTQNLAMHD